jgi:alcohol dehydrogenase class IV
MSRITYLTAIDFGPGELGTLATAPGELGMTRPLVIADKGVQAAGLLDRALAFLPA